MSVATSTFSFMLLKSASARVRAPWLLLPWMAAALMSALLSFSASVLAPCLVRMKTSTWCQWWSSISLISRSRFFALSTG